MYISYVFKLWLLVNSKEEREKTVNRAPIGNQFNRDTLEEFTAWRKSIAGTTPSIPMLGDDRNHLQLLADDGVAELLNWNKETLGQCAVRIQWVEFQLDCTGHGSMWSGCICYQVEFNGKTSWGMEWFDLRYKANPAEVERFAQVIRWVISKVATC